MMLKPISFLKKAASGGTLVTDNFNRANSNGLGSNWTDIRDQWDVVSNAAEQPTGSTSTTAFYTGATFANNQYAQCTVKQLATSGGVGPVVRGTDSSNFYYAYVSDTDWRLYSKNGGSDTQIGSTGTASLAVDDIIYLEASGTTVTLKKGGSGGTTQATGTNSDHASGDPGLNCYFTGTTFRVDDFEAGDL